MYPIEKYRFFRQGNKTIAVTTYAGRTVRGTAICDPEDEFDEEFGKKLAAARCAVKVAQKRCERAMSKSNKADEALLAAETYADKMNDYFLDSRAALREAKENLYDIMPK